MNQNVTSHVFQSKVKAQQGQLTIVSNERKNNQVTTPVSQGTRVSSGPICLEILVPSSGHCGKTSSRRTKEVHEMHSNVIKNKSWAPCFLCPRLLQAVPS